MLLNDFIEDEVTTLKDINVTNQDLITIDAKEVAVTIGEQNTQLQHALLNGRELSDQHPITAITGLKEELENIESLKTVYSDKIGFGNYYKWNSGAFDEYGYFVSFVPHTSTVKICDGNDIFGVTVDRAGFIGNQNAIVPRDNSYALVITSGIADVRCKLDVSEGDYVVSNADGVAVKTDSGCGYKVISIEEKNGVNYALISLGIQASTTDAMGHQIKILDKRIDDAEINIAVTMNTANEAYKEATKANSDLKEALLKSSEALDKANSAGDNAQHIEEVLSSVYASAEQAKSIAESAIVGADKIRQEAVYVANEALDKAGELERTVDPISRWEYTDPVTGQTNTGATYFAEYVKNGLNTKADMETVSKFNEENKLLIEKNAENFQQMLSSVDKYSIGEYSQAYGLTLSQARNILKDGMVYIPTDHDGTITHVEQYVDGDKILKRSFTKGFYYVWTLLNDGEYMWSEEAGNVWPYKDKPAGNQYSYWYDGDKLYVLYNNDWIEVATIAGNANNRITSMIRQTAENVAIEVSNARGSIAGLDARITDSESKVASLASHVIGGCVLLDTWIQDNADTTSIYYAKDTKLYWYYDGEWKSTEKSYEAGLDGSLATIEQKADETGASLSLVVSDKDGEKSINTASIVMAVNDKKSSATINADKINFTGQATFLVRQDDLKSGGETEIDGSRITTGSIRSNGYKPGDDGFSIIGTEIDLDNGSIRSQNFFIDEKGNASFNGKLVTEDGEIAGLTITENALKSSPEIEFSTGDFEANPDDVYIGMEGIRYGGSLIIDPYANHPYMSGSKGIFGRFHIGQNAASSDNRSTVKMATTNGSYTLFDATTDTGYFDSLNSKTVLARIGALENKIFNTGWEEPDAPPPVEPPDEDGVTKKCIGEEWELLNVRSVKNNDANILWVNNDSGIYRVTALALGYCEIEVVSADEDETKTIKYRVVDHNFNDGVYEKYPTCIEDGKKVQTCTRCGKTKTTTIKSTGEHTYVDDVCSVCGTSYIERTTRYVDDEWILDDDVYTARAEGSCIDVFRQDDKWWARAVSVGEGSIITTTKVIEGGNEKLENETMYYNIVKVGANGEIIDNKHVHTIVTEPAIEKTCTSYGRTEWKHCSVCNKVLVEYIEEPATGHKDTNGDGYCDVCGARIIIYDDHLLLSLMKDNSYSVMAKNAYNIPSRIEIPSTYENLSVTDIGNHAFWGSINLVDITIPDSITNIGADAFRGCKKLESITIPDGVKNISVGLFQDCEKLSTVILHDNIQTIGASAFDGCSSLKGLDILSNITRMGSAVFDGCSSLETITLPNTIDEIPDFAFRFCSSLKNINIPERASRIGNRAFRVCGLTEIKIPDNVSSIEEYAFSDCKSLCDVEIGSGVKSIGDRAFGGCKSLEYFTIPDNVVKLGKMIFHMCSNLKEVVVGDGVQSIPYGAFQYDIGLNTVILGKSIEIIDEEAFRGCSNLLTINIPNTITRIGKSAFANCHKLNNIVIPNSVTYIGAMAFIGCDALEEINIPDNVTYLGDWAFVGCSNLEKVEFGPNVKLTRLTGTFKGCESLTDVDIPYGVKRLDETFSGCTNLQNVSIPDSVTDITGWTFGGCTSLASIEIPDSVKSMDNFTFDKCTNLKKVTGPIYHDSIFNGTECAVSELIITGNRTSIDSNAFFGATSLNKVIIPNSVTSIGEGAFWQCSGLNTINIPENVTSIGENAFSGTGFTEITIPGSISRISSQLFEGCANLETVVINDGVKYIDHNAFERCGKLSSVTIPDSVEKIDYQVFNCPAGREKELIITYKGTESQWNRIDKDRIWAGAGSYKIVYAPDCNHNEVVTSGKEATCTEDGYTKNIHCSTCGKVLLKPTITPAKGHQFGDDGICDVCGYNKNTCAHSYVTDPAVAATCTTTGLTEGKHCSKCNHIEIAQETVPATGHTLVNGICSVCGGEFREICVGKASEVGDYASPEYNITVNNEQILSVYTGSQTGLWYISARQVGGCLLYVYDSKNNLVKTIAYDVVSHQYVNKECIVCGHKNDSICVGNNWNLYSGSYTLVSSNPNVVKVSYEDYDWVLEAVGVGTCTISIYEIPYDEINDSSSDVYDTISYVVVNHEYASTATPPTCINSGYTTHTCGMCNHSYVDSETPATGHKLDNGVCSVCGTKQITKYYHDSWALAKQINKCKVVASGSVAAYNEDANADGLWWADAASIGDGSVSIRDIGMSKTDVVNYKVINKGESIIDAHEHNGAIYEDAKAATCVDPGWTASKYCTICYELHTPKTIVPATGNHTYAGGVCTVCSTTETITVGDGTTFSIDFASFKDYESSHDIEVTTSPSGLVDCVVNKTESRIDCAASSPGTTTITVKDLDMMSATIYTAIVVIE